MSRIDLDIWGDLKAADVVIVDDLAGNARERVPTTAEEAAAFFRCETLAASMRGSLCASNWRAAEDGATTRTSCRSCAAGCARAALLASVGQSPMPAQQLVNPVRAVAKCAACGMRKSDARHTPAICARVQAASAAATNASDASRRKAEREKAAERARKEAETAKKRREAAAQREARAKEREEKKSAAARAREAEKAQREAAKAERAAAWAETEAKLAAKTGRSPRPAGAPKSKRVGRPPVRKPCARAAGCSRLAPAGKGPYCPRCLSSARIWIPKQIGRDPTTAEINACLADPNWLPRKVVDWSGVDWSKSNAYIASQMGVSPGYVFKERRRFGTPSTANKPKNIDWSKHPLGTMPDREIARQVGCTAESVYSARRKLGIPAYVNERLASIDWDALPLGTISDGEIAKSLGISKTTVRIERNARGIPPGLKHAPSPDADVDWSQVDMRKPNEVIAKEIGVSIRTVSRRRAVMGLTRTKKQPEKIDWSTADFGVRADVDIAAEMGVSISAVRKARTRRGIGRARHSAYDRDIDWSTIDFTLTDAANARAIGCDVRLVQRERRARGIGRPPRPVAESNKPITVDPEVTRAQYADMLARFEKRKASRRAAWERRNGVKPTVSADQAPGDSGADAMADEATP